MVEQRRADEDAPDHPRQPDTAPELPQAEEESGQAEWQEDMAAVQKTMHGVSAQVRDVTGIVGGIVQLRDVRHPPEHVCPPDPVPWTVRIAVRVAVLMMDAVDGHPLQGAPLTRQG